MINSEFYYGLPQGQWDTLLTRAEDLLRDEDIGTHLVGLYPAGNRIYGIESEPPGIMCLYVDTVESLIDPYFKSNNETGFKVYKYGNSMSPIIFANLFDWSSWIINNSGNEGWRAKNFLQVIPFGSDLIYQDDSIDDILDLTKKYLEQSKFSLPFARDKYQSMKNMAFYRASLILADTGKFYPCMNPAWGKVFTLDSLSVSVPSNIKELDAKFRNWVLGRDREPSDLEKSELISWFNGGRVGCTQNAVLNQELAAQIGQEVSKLYRFFL